MLCKGLVAAKRQPWERSPKVSKLARIDCLDDLDFMEDVDGWDAGDMVRTVGRMIKGADNVARCLATAAESLVCTYSRETPAEPKDVQAFAQALPATAHALRYYTEIYAWALSQGRAATAVQDGLEDLMGHLSVDEMRTLRSWQQRGALAA